MARGAGESRARVRGDPPQRRLPGRGATGPRRGTSRCAARSRCTRAFGLGRVAGAPTGLLAPETRMNRLGPRGRGGARRAPARSRDRAARRLRRPRSPVWPAAPATERRRWRAQRLADVQERLGRSDFPRLRFGIGRPPSGVDPIDYALAPWSGDEAAALEARLDAACDAIEPRVRGGRPRRDESRERGAAWRMRRERRARAAAAARRDGRGARARQLAARRRLRARAAPAARARPDRAPLRERRADGGLLPSSSAWRSSASS